MHTNFTNLKLSSSFKLIRNLLENSMGFDCPCFPTFEKTRVFNFLQNKTIIPLSHFEPLSPNSSQFICQALEVSLQILKQSNFYFFMSAKV
jgi:hypothetical protein